MDNCIIFYDVEIYQIEPFILIGVHYAFIICLEYSIFFNLVMFIYIWLYILEETKCKFFFQVPSAIRKKYLNMKIL